METPFHPSPLDVLLGSAMIIQDDVAYYVFRDGVEVIIPNLDDRLKSIYAGMKLPVPERIHNLTVSNRWGYPAGTVTEPVIYSGQLKPEQIKRINGGESPAAVLAETIQK